MIRFLKEKQVFWLENIRKMTKIKQATEGDTSDIIRLMKQFYQHFDYTFETAKQTLIVQTFLQNPHYGSIWLINFEEKTVGYLALTYGFTFEFGGKDAFLDELFVEEKYRSLGLGAEAIRFIQAKLTDLELNALHLQVEKYNQKAYKLYENLGFKDLKRDTLTFQS